MILHIYKGILHQPSSLQFRGGEKVFFVICKLLTIASSFLYNKKFLNFLKKRLDERKKLCYIITCVQRKTYTLV